MYLFWARLGQVDGTALTGFILTYGEEVVLVAVTICQKHWELNPEATPWIEVVESILLYLRKPCYFKNQRYIKPPQIGLGIDFE